MSGGSEDEVKLMKRRATSFLEVAKYSLQRGIYDIAAFNAEQATQLYLKATLLELIGDFPRTHSVIFLLNELKRINEKEVSDFVKENKRGLHNLEDAYLTSRYFYKIFDREDGEYLISLAEKVMSFCEKLRYSMGKSKDT
ncbi:MAG: HEPN domain-containing protein [Thermoproteota archaeon]|jgi:HEPN domain-containing protein